MVHNGSAPDRPLSPAAAATVTALGIVAMFAGAPLLARLGVGLRGVVAGGTLLLALPAVLALLALPPARRASFGEPLSPPRLGLLSALLGLAFWLLGLGLMELQAVLLPPPESYIQGFRALHEALSPKGPLDALVSLAVIAVLPGLCEELVVRGILLPSLAARITPAAAVTLSAALFAAIHWDVYRGLFTLSIGLALGALRLRTSSLWPPATAHACLNALTFALAPWLDDPSKAYSPEPLLGLAALVVGGAVAVPLWRRLPRASGSRPGPGSSSNSSSGSSSSRAAA